jgi:tetratricopeptide (TPR) repeat protein
MDRRLKIRDWIKTGLAIILVLVFGLSLLPRLQNPSGSDEALSFRSSSLLVQAARLFPDSPYLWRLAGRAALQEGNIDGAIQYFTYSGLEGLSAQDLTEIGTALLKAGDIQRSVQVWEKALAQGAAPGDIYPLLLQAHRAQQDYPAILQDLEQLLRVKPDDQQVLNQAALLAAALHPVEALPLLDSAGGHAGDAAASARQIGLAIRSAVQASTDPAYLLLESGRALASAGAWEMAVLAFDQATRARPGYAEAWAYLGMARRQAALRTNSNPDIPLPEGLGLSELQKAHQLDPASIPATIFLANYWQQTGNISQTLNILQQAVDRYPSNPLLQVELGNALAAAGELVNALHAYQQAVALAPGEAVYYRYLAEFSVKNDYYVSDIALPAARQAIILDEHDASSQDIMAQVFIQLGDLTNAERFLNQALALDPHYAPALLHLGTIFLLHRDAQTAERLFNQVITLDPGSAAATQARQFLRGEHTSP